MDTDLLEPFSFSVYGNDLSRHVLRAYGVDSYTRADGVHEFRMVVSQPGGVPNLQQHELGVRFAHPPNVRRTDEDIEALGRRIAGVLTMFVHGGALGWEVITHNVAYGGLSCDEIMVPNDVRLDQAVRDLGVDSGAMRQLCKDDLVAFGIHSHRTNGAIKSWTVDNFEENGFARFPYDTALSLEAARDLTAEKKLRIGSQRRRVSLAEAMGAEKKLRIDSQGASWYLDPEKADDLSRANDGVLAEWVQKVRRLGAKHGWLPGPSEGDAMAKMGEAPKGAPKVFIIHGHGEAKRRELEKVLRERFSLDVVIMSEQPFHGSTTLIEKLEREGSRCNAAVAVLTPDDLVGDPGGGYGQPRPNVFFELGWLAGKYGRTRVLMLVKEGTQLPSDLAGIGVIKFTKDVSEKIPELEREIGTWRNPE